jgi:isopenicillin N synthase-like dioxygenase
MAYTEALLSSHSAWLKYSFTSNSTGPLRSSRNMRIPVVDLSPHNADAASQLLDAAIQYGFVFIENDEYGISPKEIEQLFSLAKDFFASPVSVKDEVAIGSNKAGKNHGWLSRGVEKLDPGTQKRADVKEYAFHISPASHQDY